MWRVGKKNLAPRMQNITELLTDAGKIIAQPGLIAAGATEYYKKLFEGTNEHDQALERQLQDIMYAD